MPQARHPIKSKTLPVTWLSLQLLGR